VLLLLADLEELGVAVDAVEAPPPPPPPPDAGLLALVAGADARRDDDAAAAGCGGAGLPAFLFMAAVAFCLASSRRFCANSKSMGLRPLISSFS